MHSRTEQHNADPAQNNIYKYNVFLKPEDKWIKEEFNLDGQLQERIEYDYLSKILTDETIYQYDLNGDGSIGAIVEATYNGYSHSESFYKINSGDYILGTSGTQVGMSPGQQKLLSKDNKPFEFGHEPKAFYISDDMLQVKVFSGSDDSWIIDKFNNQGEFQKSRVIILLKFYMKKLFPN